MTRPVPAARLYLDALGGLDGTQAAKVRYVAPPVFPDAALGLTPTTPARRSPAPRATRPLLVPVTALPALGQLPELPVAARGVPPWPVPAPRPRQAPPTARSRQPGQPVPPVYGMAPGYALAPARPAAPVRQMLRSVPTAQLGAGTFGAGTYGAASKSVGPYGGGIYQGPVPAEFVQRAPSAPTSAFTAPAPGAQSPRNFRQAVRPGVPAAPTQRPVKKANYVQGVIFLIILALIGSGAGKTILDALFNR